MLSCLRGPRFTMKTHCFDRILFSSSPPLAPLQLPSRMETHLWYVLPNEVKCEALLNEYVELLSPCEKHNVFSMHEDELRKGALLARALVRTTIARYQINHVSPRSLKFRKNIHGKPEIEWQQSENWHPPQLHFNISHTASLVACGVTVDSPVGVDVEEKQRKIKNKILSFAHRFFSQQEVQLLNSISDPELQRQEFIKLWTLKEAYVKALGRGFSGAPFKNFTIRSRASAKNSFYSSLNSKSETSEIVVESFEDPMNNSSDWQFSLLDLAGSHYAAICTKLDSSSKAVGKGSLPMNMKVWKTIPLVGDEYVSGTDAVLTIHGLV